MFFEDRHSEFRLVQNDTFGATIVWSAVAEYFKVRRRESGIPLPLSMLILPLCYHAPTSKVIASCMPSSGLYMALSKDRTIPAGLQLRMEHMVAQSMRAILVGSNAGLIGIDNHDFSMDIVPNIYTRPSTIRFEHEAAKRIERCARRVGYWFAETQPETICALLKVRF